MSIELSDMRFFVEAVRHGSITRASLELDIQKSSGSRRITRMEKELGVQLVRRTTRKVNTTAIGKAYFDRCVQVLEDIARAEQMVTDERRTLGGRLRIAIPAELGAHRFAACFSEFMLDNPGISMEIEAGPGSRLVDVVANDVDVWIKTGEVPDSNLIVRRLGALARSLYASPVYLSRHGAPAHPEELEKHECLMLGDQPYSVEPWSFTRDSNFVALDPPSNMWVNSLAVLRQLAVSGVGLAIIPDTQVKDDVTRGDLVKVMTDWVPEPIEVNLLMSHRELLPARIRSFVDFMVAKSKTW